MPDLTPVVTKVMPDANNVKFHLELTDNAVVVIDKTYPTQYSPEDGPTDTNRAEAQKAMQKDIDAYKALKATFDRPAYLAAADAIQTGLEI
jgi:hypothetical protein